MTRYIPCQQTSSASYLSLSAGRVRFRLTQVREGERRTLPVQIRVRNAQNCGPVGAYLRTIPSSGAHGTPLSGLDPVQIRYQTSVIRGPLPPKLRTVRWRLIHFCEVPDGVLVPIETPLKDY